MDRRMSLIALAVLYNYKKQEKCRLADICQLSGIFYLSGLKTGIRL